MSISETIIIDAQPAIGELDALAGAADRAAEAMARIGKSSAGGLGADKLAASMAAAADRIEAASQRTAAAMGRLSSATRPAAAGLDALGAAADKAGAGLDRAAAGADASAAAMDRQAASAARSSRATRDAGVSHEKFWSGVKALAVGGTVAVAYGIDKAMKLQTEITRLYTAAGLTGVTPKAATQAALQIGSKTGFSAQVIAEAMYHPASAGLDWKSIQALTLQSANLANIHGASLDDTTYAMSSVMKAYNIGAKQVIPTAALLNSIVGQGDMRFQDFNQSVKNWAPTFAQMGISLKSGGAALAYLTDRGNSAEEAATRVTMGLTMMSVPSQKAGNMLIALGVAHDKVKASSDAMRLAMEKAHITTNRLALDLKKPDGIYVALNDLKTSLEKAGVSGTQADAVMTKIFGGGRSDKAMMSLMQNLPGLQQKYNQIGQGVANYGKDISTEQATAQQKWKDFLASSQNLATGFGNRLLPAFTKIAGFAANLLQGPGGGAAAGLLGGGMALFAGNKLFHGVESSLSTVGKVGSLLKIPGLDKLAGIGQGAGLNGAAANLDGSAVALKAAAADLSGAAGKESAAAAEAGKGGVGAAGKSGLSGMLGPVSLGVMVGAALRAVGDKLSPAGTNAGKVNAALQQQAGQAPSTLHPYVLGGLEAKAATSGIGLEIGNAINRGLSQASQMITAPFHALFGGGGPAKPAAPKIQPQVDTSAMDTAKAKINNELAQIGHYHPARIKIPPPDTSAMDTAKAKVQQQAALMHDGAQKELAKKVKMAPADLSAPQADVGKAKAIGANISAGLASGIEANKGAVVAAAADVANAAAAAMAKAAQTHSPSKKTIKTGKDLAAGLVVGLEGGKSAVDAAATAMGKNAAKAADIAAIDNTIKKLLSEVPKGDTGLTRMLKGDQGKLTALANQRARLEAEIADAQNIAKQAISNADITGAAGYTPVLAASSGPVSSYATISGMQGMAADSKQFAQVVGQLKKQGLNATSLSQIVQAGPSALPMALGLSQGGKGAIGQVNQLEKQIHASAAKLGNEGAPAMYQAGVDAGKGLAAGLKSQLGAVEAAIEQMAKAIIEAMKKATKSHSPSLVFAEIGYGFPEGLALGVDAGSAIAEASVRRMGQRAASAFPTHGSGPAAGGGGASWAQPTVNITVHGHVTTEHDLVNLIQEHVLTKANNNWQTGWRLPGRAA